VESAIHFAQSVCEPFREGSFYDYVGRQLTTLISRLGVESSRSKIIQSYQTICKDSMAFPADEKPPDFSRINHDGTPFQFALNLGKHSAALQFMSEAGVPGSYGAKRIRVSRKRILELSAILHVQEAYSHISGLLDEMAPATSPDLLADPAGAFWIGVGFIPGQKPQLKIYNNAKWGSDSQIWRRLDRFASTFPAFEHWQALELGCSRLKPLGMALTLHPDGPVSGRIYLSEYGQRVSYYERLAQPITSQAFQRFFQQYMRIILAEDYDYPTRSAVVSFGFDSSSELNFKFELCGHCLFASDVEAVGRLRTWLQSANLNSSAYLTTLEVLSEGRLSETKPHLHCYVGVGEKQETMSSSVYLKPTVIRPRATSEF
jgi:hypothetical protein